MNYKLSTLKNGLRVLTVPMPTLESATITVWVKTGSRLEESRVNGISHFLEHMTFKGSRKRPTAKEIAEAVDAVGGELNATTSKDWTNFYIKTRAANLEIAFDVLSDMVLNPILDANEVEREKGVIIEEIRMYEDTPIMNIGNVFEELIFNGSPLGWDTIGTPKSVKNIKKDDFISYRKIHYYPENIIITVAGGVSEKEVIKIAEKYFGELRTEEIKELRIKEFITKQKKPQVKLHPKKKEQAHLILGFLGNGRGYKNRYTEAVLSTIMGGGMSSRLFSEVRERRGLAYAVNTSIERYAETGYLYSYAGVNPQKIDEAIKVILDEHYKILKGDSQISERELAKAKEYLKGHIALTLEDTKEVNTLFGEQELFLFKVKTPEEIFKAIDKVTIEDILKEAKKLFTPSHLNLAIIGPYSDANRFEGLIE
jgi:predicted Zn-dependent peptidase